MDPFLSTLARQRFAAWEQEQEREERECEAEERHCPPSACVSHWSADRVEVPATHGRLCVDCHDDAKGCCDGRLG